MFQIAKAIADGNLEVVKSSLKDRSKLVQKVDEETYATDGNIVCRAIMAGRVDMAKYFLEIGFRKPMPGVISVSS